MIPSGATINGNHTLTYFGMYPKSKITFAAPTPKVTYVDIPAGNGSLDYTEVLNAGVMYEDRKGSIEFLVTNGSNYLETYSRVLQAIHGKKCRIVLDDEIVYGSGGSATTYCYEGRLTVNKWKSKEMFSTIVIDYVLDPYKKLIKFTDQTPSDNIGTGSLPDWLWDDLFDNIIYYGTFDLIQNQSKTRKLINPSGVAVTPSFTCSAQVRILFNGSTYTLPAGKTTSPGFNLALWDNTMDFLTTASSARVTVDYMVGAIL